MLCHRAAGSKHHPDEGALKSLGILGAVNLRQIPELGVLARQSPLTHSKDGRLADAAARRLVFRPKRHRLPAMVERRRVDGAPAAHRRDSPGIRVRILCVPRAALTGLFAVVGVRADVAARRLGLLEHLDHQP